MPQKNQARIVTLPGGKVEHRAPRNRVPSGVRCDRPKKGGGKCNLAAGWGTRHPGIGPCRLHGGMLPGVVKAAIKQELNETLGREFEIDPITALLWLVRLAAGDVQYWRGQVIKLQLQATEKYGEENAHTGLIEQTIMGKQLTLAGREYKLAQERLAKHSKTALDAGINERAIKLQEAYAEQIADLISLIRADLLSAIPKSHGWIKDLVEKKAAEMIPRRLRELDSGPPTVEDANDTEEAEWAPVA